MLTERIRPADGSQALLGQTVRGGEWNSGQGPAAARSYDELVDAASAATRGLGLCSWLAGSAIHRSRGTTSSWHRRRLPRQRWSLTSTLVAGRHWGRCLVACPTHRVEANSRRDRTLSAEPARAAERLGRLGVDVRARIDILPVEDASADLVLNRHGALDAAEVARVLRPGGRLLTQQVGPENDAELNAALSAPPPSHGTSAAALVEKLQSVGLLVDEAQTATSEVTFGDIGAVVYQLRMVAWQIPDFDLTNL